jgi:Flp pilus assembly protein TadD
MRRLLPVISGGLLLATGLLAQMVGMSTETTRMLNAVAEMGHEAIKPVSLPQSVTFEEGDDPTVVAHPVPLHEPLRAARKAAENAEHLARKKRHDEAVSKYREAVAIDPLYFQAWNNLALELIAAGKADEAEQVMRRLMQSNPEHVLVFTNLAMLLSGRHRYAEAEAVARQAMKLHKYSFKANLVLGTVLVDEGKWSDEAKITLEYAQVKYPEAKTVLDRWPD